MKQVDICVFGDSVTYAGYIKNSWANQLRWYLESKSDAEYHLFNLGINANTTTDILKRFDIEATARNPNVIIFAIGVNDSAYLLDSKKPITGLKVFKDNIKLLINKAQVYTKDIIFIGLALGDDSLLKPYPESSRGKSYDIERVKQFDHAIKEIAAENSCKYIELFEKLEFTDFSDGLHPNESGHKKMYEVIREYFT
jgi:lysophospholipase L1-like esterase